MRRGGLSHSHLCELGDVVSVVVGSDLDTENAATGFFGKGGAQTSATPTGCAIAGAATNCPLIAIGAAAALKVSHVIHPSVLLIENLSLLANLNVVVLPASLLVSLLLRQVSGLGEVENSGGEQRATNQIDRVVVVEVHGRPPNPSNVDDEKRTEAGEAVAQDKSLHDGVRSVQRRESAERNRSGRETGGVHIDAENSVNTGQTSGGSGHAVRSRSETMLILVPRRSAREDKLDGYAENV